MQCQRKKESFLRITNVLHFSELDPLINLLPLNQYFSPPASLKHIPSKGLDVPTTILHRKIQIHLLNHRREPLRPRRLPLATADALDLTLFLRVLNVKHGFIIINERGKGLALAVLDALLVDGKVDKGKDFWDNVAGVFEADGHVEGVGFLGEVFHEGNGVFLREL